MKKIMLDTSCLSNNSLELLNFLCDCQNRNEIKLYVSWYTIYETRKWKDGLNREFFLNWINENTTLINNECIRVNPNLSEEEKIIESYKIKRYDEKEYQEALKIKKILFPTPSGKKINSDYNDYKILMTAILGKMEFFAHNNPKDFENKRTKSKENIEKKYNIKMRLLNNETVDSFLEELGYKEIKN